MNFKFSDYAMGAGVATDLVNTSPVVQRSAGEVLVDPYALTEFLTEHDLHPSAAEGGQQPTAADLEEVYGLRQELRSLLETDTEEALGRAANALVARAGAGPFLERDGTGQWEWCVTTTPHASLADELAVLIGMGLLGVLRTLSFSRIRHCAAPECSGMFVDTSKAGRRRYCMPELCGNRRNVANYRARRQAEAEARAARGTGRAR